MATNKSTILKVLRRTAVVSALAVSAVSAFAVLGDGRSKTPKNKSLLSGQTVAVTPGSFTLKSGYNYRGSQVISTNADARYINVNTTITYQKGNTTYIVPLKKKIYVTTTNGGFTINH
jgi:hypothetical protein